MSHNVTKIELIERVSRVTGVHPNEVKPVVQAVLDCLSDYLAEGRRVELRNFGVFAVKKRKPRIGRNPNQPQKNIRIPSIAVATFKPGRMLRERIKNL